MDPYKNKSSNTGDSANIPKRDYINHFAVYVPASEIGNSELDDFINNLNDCYQ